MADKLMTAGQPRQYAVQGDAVAGQLRGVADRSMRERTPLTREYEANQGGRFHAATFRRVSQSRDQGGCHANRSEHAQR